MENASRALIMAGGVFIAVAIISVALYAYTNAKGFAHTSEELLSASQIQSFNRFYLAYSTGVTSEVKCIEAINILNHAVEDNVQRVEYSDKIDFYIDPVTSKTIYKVKDDKTENYIEKVHYSLSRAVDGSVNGVTIWD